MIWITEASIVIIGKTNTKFVASVLNKPNYWWNGVKINTRQKLDSPSFTLSLVVNEESSHRECDWIEERDSQKLVLGRIQRANPLPTWVTSQSQGVQIAVYIVIVQNWGWNLLPTLHPCLINILSMKASGWQSSWHYSQRHYDFRLILIPVTIASKLTTVNVSTKLSRSCFIATSGLIAIKWSDFICVFVIKTMGVIKLGISCRATHRTIHQPIHTPA